VAGSHRFSGQIALPSSREEGTALARRYRRRVWLMAFAGNCVAAIPTILSIFANTSAVSPDPAHAGRDNLVNIVLAFGYMLVFGTHWVFAFRKQFRPVAEWLGAARPATDTDRQAVLALPRRMVVLPAVYLVAVPVWVIPLNRYVLGVHLTTLFDIQITFGLLSTAATALILIYLLAERGLRPITGLAMHGSTSPRPSTVGALPRLMLAFGAGVIAPLIAVAVGMVGLNARQKAGAFPSIWAGIATVIVAGCVVAVVSARALTDPVGRLRERFKQLKAGDLDVEVLVDEPGEIGELQAGFNDLVAGLREREQIRAVFGRLVGKEVAQHALEHDSGFDGDVREATAMFVDMIGSTSLAESTTPRDYLTKLNAFFDIVVRHVEAAGGFVNQFHGDGAVCIFGALVVQEDHAVRALRAARTLRGDLDCFAETSGIESVIGLSTGTVIAGQVGTRDRYELAVVGDAVNEAKRLSDEAKATDVKVLVSEATIRAAEGEVGNWSESGSVHLRGRSGPTTAFALRGPAADERNR
jgi:adenylate cyclase